MIETKRLIIRNWKQSDAPDLYELCFDPELRRSGLPFYRSVEESRAAIELWTRENEQKAMILKTQGRLIGLIGLGDMNRYEQYKELEYAVAAPYRNQGYATEALLAMTEYGFTTLKLSVIAAWVRSFNRGSARVLEKCSFTLEGKLRKHGRDKSDTLCYSILKEEWEAVRQSFAVPR